MSRHEIDYGVRPCCLPGCGRIVPRTREHPVCRDCCIKIACSVMGESVVRAAMAAKIEDDRRALKKRRTAELKSREVVYYLDMGDAVKIGYTGQLEQRIRQLRRSTSDLLAWEPGGRDAETLRHSQFRSERLGRREDFAKSDRLMKHIEEISLISGPPPIDVRPNLDITLRRDAG